MLEFPKPLTFEKPVAKLSNPVIFDLSFILRLVFNLTMTLTSKRTKRDQTCRRFASVCKPAVCDLYPKLINFSNLCFALTESSNPFAVEAPVV